MGGRVLASQCQRVLSMVARPHVLEQNKYRTLSSPHGGRSEWQRTLLTCGRQEVKKRGGQRDRYSLQRQ